MIFSYENPVERSLRRMVAKSFATPRSFRAWLAKHAGRMTELSVRCFKVSAAHRGVTYTQALDEALCFG